MTRASAAVLAAALLLPGCRGTVPALNEPPEQAISAILISGRMILPTGESRSGITHFNLESEGGRSAEIYRIPVAAGRNYLYLIEPGTYRIAPTRSLFGYHQPTMRAIIDGRSYRLPFPRELLRQPALVIEPSRILTLGVLETEVLPALPGQKPTLRVRLDDSVAARRRVVQDTIRDMMDPSRTVDVRESAVAWSRALQNSLLDILAEEEKRPLFKPAP